MNRARLYSVARLPHRGAKGTRETVVITPLKRGDIWNSGAIKQHRAPNLRDSHDPLSFPQQPAQGGCNQAAVVRKGRGGGGAVWRTGGGRGKWMGSVSNGNLPPFLTGLPVCVPFTSAPTGAARTGRGWGWGGEMRTGGGLSFSEERSSPCRSAEPIGRRGNALATGTCHSRSFKIKELDTKILWFLFKCPRTKK